MGATRRLNALIMGPPGGGKGTVAGRIVKHFEFYHLSTGDVLRSHVRSKTEVGRAAHAYIQRGALVPDEVIVNLVVTETRQRNSVSRLLLDGFPRTIPQAVAIDRHMHIDVVIDLNIPDETIIARIANRWIHPGSGRTYSNDFNPPKQPFVDDVTGEPLVQRDDDKPEAVANRLLEYRKMSMPLKEHYDKKGVLKQFAGTESNVIYPKIRTYLEGQGL